MEGNEDIWVEIDAVESIINALKKANPAINEAIVSSTTVLGSLSSAQETLPPEILSAIFIHAAGPMVELKPRQLPFPLALSHVCSRWRQIAILEPQIWSNVQIEVSADSYSVQLDKTHKFFSMAQSPISLHVRHTGWRTGARDFITALITPFIAQIKSLSLSFPLRSLAHLFMSKGLSFRALSALEIRFTDFYLDNITENIDMRLTAFSVDSAPLLKTVKFTGENPHLFSRFSQGLLSNLYLYQLTHLEIWDMHVTVDIAFHLLRQCMALASCVLTLNGPAPANHPLLPDVEPISLQSLKKLQLEASDEGGLELFLGALALPSLADVVFISTATTCSGRTKRLPIWFNTHSAHYRAFEQIYASHPKSSGRYWRCLHTSIHSSFLNQL